MKYIFNHGHVMLEKSMGDELDILNAAKASFAAQVTEVDDRGKGILRFLMENAHGSPWESVVFRFSIRAPIFVVREHFRHRIGSYSEESFRYSTASGEFYVPDAAHVRTQIGSPGSYTFTRVEDPMLVTEAQHMIESSQREAVRTYRNLVDKGIAKELARVVLPVGMFSTFIWTVNLRALFNFLGLRNHPDAQQEIREYAEEIEAQAAEVVPYAFELFNQFGRKTP